MSDVYLGNPLLKKANTPMEFTQEQIEEFIKCQNDPVYFAKNYVKIVTLDHGLQPFKMYPFQEKLVKRFHKHRFNICKMPRQTGKQLALDTKIPAPNGWTTIGELKIGDTIFARDGNPTKVIGKSEIQKIDTYEIEFDNGEVIKACGEHLWKVSHSDWYHKEKVLNTAEIIKKFSSLKKSKKSSSIYINIANSLNLPEAPLPIDPYTFGVWLGDGSRSNGAITGIYEDIEIISNNIPLQITKKSKIRGNNWRYYFSGLRKETHSLGLDKEKYIPEEYLRSSTNQRLQLLRGLMDTDGSVAPNGACEFYQKEGKLLYQVRELISSLGIKSRLRFKKVSGYSGNYGTISFSTTKYEVFTLPRKLDRQKNTLGHPKNERLYIKDIRKVETEPMQCISVDNPEHLFLCGDTFIPTHNSTTVVSFLLHFAVFNDNVNIGILANKAATARELLDRLQTAYENLPKWMQQGIVSWNKGSLELENGSKILAASTSASAVRGMSFNILFLDEFAFVPNHIADSFFASVYPTITSGKNTKVIIVSCVTKDTYLLTDKGYRKIQTLIDKTKEGAYIVPEYTVRGNDKFYSSTIVVNNKKSSTNIIKTRYEEIECSENHMIWAFKNGEYGYFKSKDLNVGDHVAVKYNHQVFGNDDYIGFNPEKGKSQNCFSCDYINEDIAYFIGLYVSEGYARDIINGKDNNIKGGQIIITCGDDISPSLDKLNLTYSKNDDVHYSINSKHLVEFLKELGFDIKNKAPSKILPDKVLSWSKKNIVALLRGMFDGDGCIDKRGRISYTSTSRELIRQVQLLLSNLGILGSLYETTSKPSKIVKVNSTHYTIEISGEYAFKYFGEIGFNLERKKNKFSFLKVNSRNVSRTDIIPNSSVIIEENKNKDISKLNLKNGRSKEFKNYSRKFLLSHKENLYQVSNDILREFLEDNVQENLIWLEIKEIEKSENEVFDVSLPDIEGDKWAHSVLYNNFLGHQTPHGMNHFYRMWHDAEKGKNEYIFTDVHWSEVPGRDEEWKKQTIANTSEQQFKVEFESISPNSLINVEEDGIIKEVKIGDLYERLSSNKEGDRR